MNECFFTKSVKNLSVARDTKKATAPAIPSMMNACAGILIEFWLQYEAKSAILSRLAAPITGIAAKNENSAALFLGIPSILDPMMVAPDREVPGIIAKA